MKQSKLVWVLMLSPALIIIVFLFLGGLLLGLSQSLGYMPLIGESSLSLDAYLGMVSSVGFLRSLGLTLFVSIFSTAFTIVLAVLTALVLRPRFAGKKFFSFIYQFPLTIPHLVIAVGMLLLVSQSGLLARLAYHIGMITEQSQFPIFIADRFGLGIILVYLWKEIPFIGLIALAVLQSVGRDFEEQGRTLGASRWQTFRYILLPLILPGILPGSIIIFAYTFGSFEVPYLLGKTFPTMLSVLSYRWYVDVDLNARPQAMAMSLFIAAFVTVLVLIYHRLSRILVRR